MSTDPASLNLSIDLTGLSITEVTALLHNMPSGARWNGAAHQPAIGGLRYQVSISGLSVEGARNLVGGLHAHLKQVWDADALTTTTA